MQKFLLSSGDSFSSLVETEAERFRKGVAVVLQNEEGKIFFALRSDEEGQGDWVTDANGEWVMPQGGLEKGENPYKTLLRELDEEAGIKEKHVTLISSREDYLAYKFEPLIEPAKWIGQAHQWFLCKFSGDPNKDIDLNTSKPAEFQKYEWATPEEICKKAQPFHRAIYTKVFQDLGLLKQEIALKKPPRPQRSNP